MSVAARARTAETPDWGDLAAEFDRWGEAGRVASLWWRDDDAIGPSPALASLLELAAGAPLALAVIPAGADPELPGFVESEPQVAVLQHGWRHTNHAAAGAKKSEFPPVRSASAVAAELAEGRARLAELFGARALPVLVPPWNRFAHEFVPLLTKFGIMGLSTMASPNAPPLPPDLAAVDVHVDVVAWHAGRGFIGEAAALGGLIDELEARRCGRVDPHRPTGILTHHLVMDRATMSFLDQLAATVERHAAARWAGVAERLPGQ